MELPTTNIDIQLHRKINAYQFHDIYPISSPKKKKITYTNVTSSQNTNRRLDRIYISHTLHLKCNTHYATLKRFSFSTHLPVTTTFYFNRNQDNNTTNNNKNHIIVPLTNGNYQHRSKLMDPQLLKDPKILSYIFQPTIIDVSQPLKSYELYVDKVKSRYKQVSKQVNRHFPSRHARSPLDKLLYLKESNDTNILSNHNYESLNKRFKKKLQQVTFSEDLISSAHELFTNLYSDEPATNSLQEDNVDEEKFLHHFDKLELSVTEQNELIKPITKDDLKSTLDRIIRKGSSSPGVDGITFYVWKKSWQYSAPYILLLAQHLLHNDSPQIPQRVNHILIRMIPKPSFSKSHPDANHLRPISLINTSIRLINNLITQRLLNIISSKITPLQQAFMPHTNMHRHIVTTKLLVDQINQLPPNIVNLDNNTQIKYMALLDMAKAFDSVNHKYIKKILQRMAFPPYFINYILDQIGNNTAQLLNGKYIAADNIPINRGTRQGLPISPILFNLCIEPLVLEIYNILSGIPILPTYLPPYRTNNNTAEDKK